MDQRQVASVQVEIFADRRAMGAAAARDVAAALSSRLERHKCARIIFASAPSQSDMLEHLAAVSGIDWSRVTAFHMDEYIGLAKYAPQRFGNWLDSAFFQYVRPGCVHYLAPDPNPELAARHYAGLLAERPIDIVCLGIGVNGHLAFNDPPVADFSDPVDVKVVTLDAVCRQQQVDDNCFATLDEVPLSALTLTLPRLLRADQLFCVVPGLQKKAAVESTLKGPIATSCPASILRTHSNCTLYLDKESAPDD